MQVQEMQSPIEEEAVETAGLSIRSASLASLGKDQIHPLLLAIRPWKPFPVFVSIGFAALVTLYLEMAIQLRYASKLKILNDEPQLLLYAGLGMRSAFVVPLLWMMIVYMAGGKSWLWAVASMIYILCALVFSDILAGVLGRVLSLVICAYFVDRPRLLISVTLWDYFVTTSYEVFVIYVGIIHTMVEMDIFGFDCPHISSNSGLYISSVLYPFVCGCFAKIAYAGFVTICDKYGAGAPPYVLPYFAALIESRQEAMRLWLLLKMLALHGNICSERPLQCMKSILVSISMGILLEVVRRMQLAKMSCFQIGCRRPSLTSAAYDLKLRSSFSFSYTPLCTIPFLVGLAVTGRAKTFALRWSAWVPLILFFLGRMLADVVVLMWQRALRASRNQARKQSLLETLTRLTSSGEHDIPCFTGHLVSVQTVQASDDTRDNCNPQLLRRVEMVATFNIIADSITFSLISILGAVLFVGTDFLTTTTTTVATLSSLG